LGSTSNIRHRVSKKESQTNAPYYDYQLNDILTPILGAIPVREAARIAVTASEKLNNELEQCAIPLIEEMKEVNERLIDRSIHRNLHLDEIENAIR